MSSGSFIFSIRVRDFVSDVGFSSGGDDKGASAVTRDKVSQSNFSTAQLHSSNILESIRKPRTAVIKAPAIVRSYISKIKWKIFLINVAKRRVTSVRIERFVRKKRILYDSWTSVFDENEKLFHLAFSSRNDRRNVEGNERVSAITH